MKIKSNALPHEVDSPFFKANKKFCQDFERFIASKKGLVKGLYNASSYIIEGKFSVKNNWNVKYKRAVYTGTGNLWLSAKFENLLSLASWSCEHIKAGDTYFFIRKRKFIDFFNPPYKSIKDHSKYVIKTRGVSSSLPETVIAILKPLFESREIYQITLKNNKLTVELRTETHHFDVLNDLIQL